jgi:hypothetical protein
VRRKGYHLVNDGFHGYNHDTYILFSLFLPVSRQDIGLLKAYVLDQQGSSYVRFDQFDSVLYIIDSADRVVQFGYKEDYPVAYHKSSGKQSVLLLTYAMADKIIANFTKLFLVGCSINLECY